MALDLSDYDESELGTVDDASVSEETTVEVLTHDGKTFLFEIRSPSWRKKNQILKDNLTPDDSIPLDVDGYYADMLEWMIVDSSLDTGIASWLARAEPALASQLEDVVPDPVDNLPDDTQKKSGK